MKGLSDSNLNQMWRKTVLKKFGNKCFFCSASADSQVVECHHVVKRKTFLLRYDWRNGIPACKWLHSGNKHFKASCHQHAETIFGKAKILEYIEPHRDYLHDREGQSKDWFIRHNITRNEYLLLMKQELQEIISS
jgi:hypothetical protein